MALTDEQFKALSDILIDTSKNIYYIVEDEPFNHDDFTDDDWQKLKKIGKLFRCEECSMWKPIADESDTSDHCIDCECDE